MVGAAPTVCALDHPMFSRLERGMQRQEEEEKKHPDIHKGMRKLISIKGQGRW